MNDPSQSASPDEAALEAAARWVVRRSRGLSEAEAAEFARWLAEDPRHESALVHYDAAWALLEQAADRIPCPDLPEPHSTRRFRPWLAGVGLAAALAIAALGWLRFPARPSNVDTSPPVAAATPAVQTRMLSDGTTVQLNGPTEVVDAFTSEIRLVHLLRGEAHFTVTPDAARPFVVQVGGAAVRAIGTAFNVRLQADLVDVIVTEGEVRVTSPNAGPPDTTTSTPPESTLVPADAALVSAGNRAVVPLPASSGAPAAPLVVSPVAPADIARALAWSTVASRTAGGMSLAELLAEFERRTGRRTRLARPEVGDLRIGGRFSETKPEELVRILRERYGVHSQVNDDGVLVVGGRD